MKPAIIIEFDGGTRQIYITKIGLFLVGATTFVAVHLFIHAAIAFYTQITKQLTKKKRPASLKLPRGGSNLAIFEQFDAETANLAECISKPGVYIILKDTIKNTLRQQLETFSNKIPVIVDALSFLVANYMVKQNPHIQDLAIFGLKATIQNNLSPAKTYAIVAGGSFAGAFIFVHFVSLIPKLMFLAQYAAKSSFLASIFGAAVIYFNRANLDCADYVKYYPITEPNEQVVIDVKAVEDLKPVVILPEKERNMMFLQTTKDINLIFSEYSEEICEVQIPKNAGLETVEPRGPKKGDGYFKEKCSRSRNLKSFSGKIHTLDDFKTISMPGKKVAEKELRKYPYEYKEMKDSTKKIHIPNENQNYFTHEDYDE